MQQQPQARPAAAAPAQKRMSLANVTTRHKRGPRRILFYGPEGIGKTTWAANAPAPVFIAPENGYPAGIAPPAFPEPRNWRDILDAVEELIQAPHEFKTVVFDTMDWIARDMLYPFICASHKKPSIEAFEYGAGYKMALQELAAFVGKLERLRTTRGMTVVLLMHAEQKTYQNPSGPDYDRFIPKLNERLSGMLREWVDLVLFGNYEVLLKSKRKEGDDRALTERAKIKGGGARVIYTNPRPAFMAKNRDDLPDVMAMDFGELLRCLDMDADVKREKADKLRAELRIGLQQLGDAKKTEQTEAWLAKVGDDLGKLQIAQNKLTQQLAERAQDQEAQEIAAQQVAAGLRPEDAPPPAPPQPPAAPTPPPVDLPEPPTAKVDGATDFRPDEPENEGAWDGFGEGEGAPPPREEEAPRSLSIDDLPPPPPPPVAQPQTMPEPPPGPPPIEPLGMSEPQTPKAWGEYLFEAPDVPTFEKRLKRLNDLRTAKHIALNKGQAGDLRSVVESCRVKLGMATPQP